jgi:ribosomal protein S18 acetylase RimI-like enzyme
LLAAVVGEVERDLYVTVDEGDAEAVARFERVGFVLNRRESNYLIPTDPELTGLGGVDVPLGFVLARADEVDLDRLRLLDDELRQDVPGTDGWAWDEAGFREELMPPSFDAATYLVAVEQAKDSYAGIVRVWHKPERPRLGFVGVHRTHRRRGLARALLAQVFGVLDARGQPEVSTEIDDENVPSRALLEPLGARRTGGSIELVARASR